MCNCSIWLNLFLILFSTVCLLILHRLILWLGLEHITSYTAFYYYNDQSSHSSQLHNIVKAHGGMGRKGLMGLGCLVVLPDPVNYPLQMALF